MTNSDIKALIVVIGLFGQVGCALEDPNDEGASGQLPDDQTGDTQAAVTGSASPKGYLDSPEAGWTCDPDNFDVALQVHFYEGAGFSNFRGATTANLLREPAVGDQCGGRRAHGFSWELPANLRDGHQHVIYAYAINVTAGGALTTPNPLLAGSPKTIPGTPGPLSISPAGSNRLQNKATSRCIQIGGATAIPGGCGSASRFTLDYSFDVPGVLVARFKKNGRCVTSSGGGSLSMPGCDPSDYRQWWILGSRSSVRNLSSDLCLTDTPDAKLAEQPCNGGLRQFWTFPG